MVFVLAYSGFVSTMTIVGEDGFVLAYSGVVFSMTIEGVSFRTGLRGQGRGEIVAQVPRHPPSPALRDLPPLPP